MSESVCCRVAKPHGWLPRIVGGLFALAACQSPQGGFVDATVESAFTDSGVVTSVGSASDAAACVHSTCTDSSALDGGSTATRTTADSAVSSGNSATDASNTATLDPAVEAGQHETTEDDSAQGVADASHTSDAAGPLPTADAAATDTEQAGDDSRPDDARPDGEPDAGGITVILSYSVSVQPPAVSFFELAERVQLEAWCHYASGAVVDCGERAVWSSSAPDVASVSANGELAPVANGSAKVRARVGAQRSAPVAVQVALGRSCDTLQVTGPSSLAAGQSAQLGAWCISAGETDLDVTSLVAWSSSEPGVATITSSAQVEARVEGATELSAHWVNPDQQALSTTLALTVLPPELLQIVLSPAAPSALPAGQTQQFAALCVYGDGQELDCTEQVTWSVAPSEHAEVSTQGLVSTLSEGTVSVSANLAQVAAQAVELNVLPPVVTAVLLREQSLEVNQRRQFAAQCELSDGNFKTCTQEAQWASSDSQIVRIDAQGMAMGWSMGECYITASVDGVQAQPTLAQVLAPTGCDGTLSFPDPVLEARVRSLVNKPAGNLYYDDVQHLTSFDVLGDGYIHELTGMACLTALTQVNFTRNSLSEMGELLALVRLESVNLWGNSLTQIPDLSVLSELNYFNVAANALSDVFGLVVSTSLGSGDVVDISNNGSLDCTDPNLLEHIDLLLQRGVLLTHPCDDSVVELLQSGE